jgi:hypothetical protein
MSGVTTMLVVLGLSGATRAPDLEVEAVTATGRAIPELAEAVARALVAGGARVVLKAPTSAACQYCAKVAVVEEAQGACRIEVSQDRHRASAVLRLPSASPLLDRARAIAIQARLLVTWETKAETRAKETVHEPARKPETTLAEAVPTPPPAPARDEPAPPAPARATGTPPETVRPAAEPVPADRPAPLASTAPGRSSAPASAPAPAMGGRPPSGQPASGTDAKPKLAEREERSPSFTRQPAAAPSPALDLGARTAGTPGPRWPWIPIAIGAGAAIAAGVCAGIARDRYDALSDRSQTVASAQAIKSEGERWQLASFVLAGTAAVGLGTGLIGFATGSKTTVVALPTRDGGMVALRGELP